MVTVVFSTRIALCAGLLALAGCTWVAMEPGGRAVQVASPTQELSGCGRSVGTITVSVRDSIAFVERNALKVRDELETLARNEATSLSADTVQPLGEPRDGEQRFAAYRCDGVAAPAARAPTSPVDENGVSEPAGAETFPIDQRNRS